MAKGASKYTEIVTTLRKEMGEGRYASSAAFPSVTALMRRIADARLPPRRILLPARLVIRESTGKGKFQK